jgi:hypothetical protein
MPDWFLTYAPPDVERGNPRRPQETKKQPKVRPKQKVQQQQQQQQEPSSQAPSAAPAPPAPTAPTASLSPAQASVRPTSIATALSGHNLTLTPASPSTTTTQTRGRPDNKNLVPSHVSRARSPQLQDFYHAIRRSSTSGTQSGSSTAASSVTPTPATSPGGFPPSSVTIPGSNSQQWPKTTSSTQQSKPS